MPLVNCLAKPELQGLDSGDVSRIQELVARYEADGQTPARAEQSAVQAILSDVYQERASISSQVVAKGGLPPSRTAVENAATTVRPGGLSSGQTRAITNQFIEPFKQIGIQNVRVINSGQVQGITGQAVPEGKIVKGFLLNDTAYVVHDNLQSQADVETALAHEVVGHLGINNIMSGEQWASLKKEYQAYKSAGNQAFNDLVSEVNRRYNNPGIDTEVKEALALMAEQRNRRGPIEKLYKKAVSLVVEGLRKLGVIRGQFMQAQMDRLLDRSESFLRSEPQAEGIIDRAMEPQFAQNDNLYHQIPLDYIVESKGAIPEKPSVLKALNPKNQVAQYERLSNLASSHPDPLKSPRSWLKMERELLADNRTPPPPYRLIRLVNDTDKWAADHSRLSQQQIDAAAEGFKIVEEMNKHYESGNPTEHDTGKLMLWGMLSRMLSAHPHESAFLDAVLYEEDSKGDSLDNFIQTAVDREWTDADVKAYLDWAGRVIPEFSPGKQGTSNLNDFGKIFLKKLSKRNPEDGRSQLSHLHDLFSDRTISSADVRRRFYGLGEGLGIKNKVLSFALLMSGRQDVVILDRIQINSMWDAGRYGKLIYDDVANLFDEAHGLARYEALERSLMSRIDEMYQKVGRPEDSSIGRYHWESWVLNSGQVVSHPTMEGIVDYLSGKKDPFYDVGAPEGRYHTYSYGSVYARDADGSYIMYPQSDGTVHRFSLKEFKDFLDEVKKPKNGVIPKGFSVKMFREAGYPWYESEEVNRNELDGLIERYSQGEFSPEKADTEREATDLTGEGSAPQFSLELFPGGSDVETVNRYLLDENKDPNRLEKAVSSLSQGLAKAYGLNSVEEFNKAYTEDEAIFDQLLEDPVLLKAQVTNPEIFEDQLNLKEDGGRDKAVLRAAMGVQQKLGLRNLKDADKVRELRQRFQTLSDREIFEEIDKAFGSPVVNVQFSMDDVNEIEQEEQASAASKGLPMDKESRMQRAEFMGFDTDQVWYHGTSSDVEGAFIPSTDGNLGPGIYFTPSTEKGSSRAMIARFKSGDTGAGPNVVPVFLRQEKILELDQNPVTKVDTERLKSEGYTGIKLTENGVVKEIVLFRPEDVRSVNAAFDVENMSESDILYSMEDDPDMDVFEDEPAEMQASEHYDFQPSRDIDVMPQREANEVVSRDATGRRILAKNLTVDDGDLVGVRLNLNVFKSTGIAVQAVHKGTTKGGHKQNKGFWNGEVLTYAPAVSLKNAYFNVQQKARDGIATGDNKMPMASVDGEYATNPNPSFGGIEIRFNPKDVRFFTDMDGRPIRYAEEVTIHGTRAYASGQIEYYKRDTAPERYSDAPSDVQFSVDQDLPMDTESRMARAEEQGFDTSKVWYHANTGGIEGEGFDNSRLPSWDPDAPFEAHWFSNEPSEFAAYPSTGNTITPVYLNRMNPATYDDVKAAERELMEKARSGEVEYMNELPHLRQLLVDKGFDYIVWRGREPINAKELEETGETEFRTSRGMKSKLKWDTYKFQGEEFPTLDLYEPEIGYVTGYESLEDFEGAYPEEDTIAVFNPEAIRSVNAAFDPGKSPSRNLLYSMFSRDPNDDPEFTEEEAKAINETQAYYKSPGASSIERFRSATDRAGTKILQKIFDPAASVRTILKDERLYRITDLAQSVSGPMQAIAQYGRPFWKDDVIQVDTKQKSFQQILAPLGSDAEVKKFLSWIIAERASNLKKENREILLTDEHIRIFKNFHRQNRALYDSVWKEFQGMQNAIYDIAVKTGNLSQEQAEVYKNSFYLPFYRELEEVSEGQQGSRFGGKSGKLVEQELFRKLKGSEKRIEDPLENILLNWHHVLGAAKRNDAGKRILQAAEDLGLSQKIDQRDAKKDPNATYVWEDGKRQWYTVDDSTDGRLLMETLGALNYDMGPWEKFAAGLAPFKHYLTWGVTVDPEFKVANFIRDTITAIGVADMSANPIKNITDGWKATKDMTDVKAQMLASGAIFSDSGFIHGGDPDAIRYLIGSKGVDRRSILDTPEKMLEFVKAGEFLSLPRSAYRKYQDAGVRLENVNRAANFVQAMEDEGKTILDAAYESRDHLAFDRMGTWRFARFMARTVPFLNARAQGLYKFGRAATDENQRKRFGATATAYAMASAALYLSMADDEDYKAAEDWERDTYHIFKAQPVAEAMGLDKETLFRIPRAFEFGAIGTLAERALEQATNDEVNGALFLQRVGHMLTHTFSIQAPAAFTPLLELNANRSFFTDRPIESIYQRSNLPPEERGSAANTALAQYMSSAMAAVVPESLSESLVLSPPQIDHLARGYLAFVGDSAMKASNWAIKKAGDNPPPAANISEWLPPVARFVRNPDAPSSTKYSSLFYDRRDKINKIKGTVDKALREKNVEKAERIWEENAELLELHRYYNRAARYMSEINGEIRMIGADKELSSGEKREQIDELKREKAALMYEIHEETRGVFDDGYNPRVFRP